MLFGLCMYYRYNTIFINPGAHHESLRHIGCAEGGELVLRNVLVLRAEALVTVALVGSKASALSAARRVQQWQPGAEGVALQKHEPPHQNHDAEPRGRN